MIYVYCYPAPPPPPPPPPRKKQKNKKQKKNRKKKQKKTKSLQQLKYWVCEYLYAKSALICYSNNIQYHDTLFAQSAIVFGSCFKNIAHATACFCVLCKIANRHKPKRCIGIRGLMKFNWQLAKTYLIATYLDLKNMTVPSLHIQLLLVLPSEIFLCVL